LSKRKRDQAQPEPQAVTAPYEPTEREREAAAACLERRRNRPQHVGIKVERRGDTVSIGPEHPDLATGSALLCTSLGTGSHELVGAFVEGLIQATAHNGEAQAKPLNDALAMVQALQPQDEVEAMLTAHMAMVHQAVMHSTRRLQHCDTLQQLEAHDRCLNRLTRTYAAQMDALKRYRTGGQQRMTVEHVHVHEGGQAIVGSVHHGGGAAASKPEPTS
jgi:hypothetical protein